MRTTTFLLACLIALPAAFGTACVTSGDSPFCESGDCNAEGACGDGVCNPTESCSACAEDCGPCGSAGGGDGGAGGASCLDYESSVQPILDQNCTVCHGGADPPGNLSLTSHGSVLAGGESGPAVNAGDCAGSLLWQITGPSPPGGLRMPANGPPYLADEQRQALCRWIDEGALATAEGCTADPPSDSGGDGGADPQDATAPQFPGIDYTEPVDGGCQLYWIEAIDDSTPAPEIEYRIFYAEEDQALDYSAPTEVALGADLTAGEDANERVYSLTLSPGLRYEVAVRAADAAGNADGNLETETCDLR